MSILKEFIYRLRGEYTTERLVSMGMKVGKNFHRLKGVILDPSHCWLIEIGDNVVIGAGSIVTHDIPDSMVVMGNPARVVCPLEDYLQKEKSRMDKSSCYGDEYTLHQNVPMEMRLKQKSELNGKIGYIH